MGPRIAKNTATKTVTTRKSFQWTPEIHFGMAEYVCSKYNFYKKSLGTQRKTEFLRAMRDHLNISVNDKQLKNGFQNFLGKYENVKKKLNSSGFGVDPEKDRTLDKGWILKTCPYYDILDQVMRTRPNVNPPFVISTSIYEGADVETVDQSKSEYERLSDVDDPLSIVNDANEQTADLENSTSGITEPDELHDTIPSSDALSDSESTRAYVRESLKSISLKKGSTLSLKTPLGVFTKVMGDKIEENSRVEREKMQIQVAHFENEQIIQKEKNEIERFRVHSQIELEKRRLDIEEQRFVEKKEEREHELKKLKLEQEFELKKMELQLKINNTS